MLVLLDRDGVINHDRPEGVLRFEDFRLLPNALEGVAKLTKAGYRIAICTNQSAVGKGILRPETLEKMHQFLCDEVAQAGGCIDKIYVATDAPGTPSTRRKPAPGMLLEALEHFGEPARSTPMVGDMLRDMEAAHAAGCPRILVRTGKGQKLVDKGIPELLAPVVVCDDLLAAAEYICAHF